MIQTFPNTVEGEAQAFAVTAPRDISSDVVNGERVWIVRTGDDLPKPEPVRQVKNWQMRRALNAVGLRAQIEGAVAQASQDVRDMWDYAPEIDRSHPFVEQMRAGLSLTEQQVDELFAYAASVQQ